jgi:predicted DNA-binding protein (MmcQ/YjbR family)
VLFVIDLWYLFLKIRTPNLTKIVLIKNHFQGYFCCFNGIKSLNISPHTKGTFVLYNWFVFADIWRIIEPEPVYNAEEIRNYCLQFPHVEESFPFDEDTLVFKVAGKMFILMSLSSQPVEFNVKCEPALAEQLRETYEFVMPGYHMNKTHWNTVVCSSKAPKAQIHQMIRHSYQLVVSSLPKKIKHELGIVK